MKQQTDNTNVISITNAEPYISGFFNVNFNFDNVNLDYNSYVRKVLEDNMFSPDKNGLDTISKILSSTCVAINYDPQKNNTDEYYITTENMEFSNLDQKPCAVYRAYNALVNSNINFFLDTYTYNGNLTSNKNSTLQFAKCFKVIAINSAIDEYMSSNINKVDRIIIVLKFQVIESFSFKDSYNRCMELFNNLKKQNKQ